MGIRHYTRGDYNTTSRRACYKEGIQHKRGSFWSSSSVLLSRIRQNPIPTNCHEARFVEHRFAEHHFAEHSDCNDLLGISLSFLSFPFSVFLFARLPGPPLLASLPGQILQRRFLQAGALGQCRPGPVIARVGARYLVRSKLVRGRRVLILIIINTTRVFGSKQG